MRVLVTGGAGFLGSHLVGGLLAAGHEPVAFDDLSTGDAANVPRGAELRVADVCEREAVEDTVEGVDLVLHLAAAVGARLVAADPVGTWVRNVEGTRIVLEACARRRTRVLLASSSEVYGPGREGPLRERDPAILDPAGRRDVYALSKAAGEAYAQALHRADGLPATVLRLFNVVGRGQSHRYGMVLPRFAAAVRARRPLTVYGDGAQRRCFLHVEDAVRAILGLATTEDAVGQVVNVGNREEIRILDLARLVLDESGEEGRIERVPFEQVFGSDFPDPRRRVPDVSRLHALTGFAPRLGVRDAVRDLLEVATAREA